MVQICTKKSALSSVVNNFWCNMTETFEYAEEVLNERRECLKRKIKEAGLTIEEFAEKLGVHRNTAQRWLGSGNWMDADQERLARKILGIADHDFFDLERFLPTAGLQQLGDLREILSAKISLEERTDVFLQVIKRHRERLEGSLKDVIDQLQRQTEWEEEFTKVLNDRVAALTPSEEDLENHILP